MPEFCPAVAMTAASWWMLGGAILVAVGLVIGCAAAWSLNLLGLPGNWVAVGAIAIYAWVGPSEGRLSIGVGLACFAFGLGLLGEVLEFVAGAAGASRAGASRRATLFSIIGSMAGALTGALIGLPIPVVGPLIAAILFGGLGATAGAIYAEWTDGRPWKESWKIGQAAFVGRTFGTLGKSGVGLGIVLLAIAGVCL